MDFVGKIVGFQGCAPLLLFINARIYEGREIMRKNENGVNVDANETAKFRELISALS